MYGAPSTTACESNNLAQDLASRDFACNSCYYDHANDVLIDGSGRGIADAKANILHPASDDHAAWLAANGPRNFARAFKFIGRGYAASPALVQLMQDHFVSQMGRPNGAYQAKLALDSAAKKTPNHLRAEHRAVMTKWVAKTFPKQPELASAMKTLIKAYQ